MSDPAGAHRMSLLGIILALSIGQPGALSAQLPAPRPASATSGTVSPPGIQAFSYADLADLALRAQVVAGVTVTKAERLKGELAPGLAPGRARFLVQAATGMLLRGAEGLPGSVSYIVDVPLTAQGKAPKFKKGRFILIADRVAGRPLELRLTSPYSHLDWTQNTESRLRALLTEASAPGAPPVVTGIGNAFHVPGAIPGESESQIFLTTADSRPISLTVLRRPGEQPQWAVALGEMVDDGARAPARDSLLWYRLSCALPAQMPAKAVAALSAGDAAAVREDYALIIRQLGPCGRTIAR